MPWKLKRTTQCAKCPWRKAVDPYTIPNGYDLEKHRALQRTIAPLDDPCATLGGTLHIMACHETDAAHCIGWLWQQVGPGNNVALRLLMRSCTNGHKLRLRGEQHATFDATLPPQAADKERP